MRCAVVALLALLPCITLVGQSPRRTRNVVIAMTDGFRWQEVFHGADATLLTDANNHAGGSTQAFQARYLVGTPEQNRAALMPFFWSTMARQGQIFGDVDLGSEDLVTNGFNRSYPGYNETLTGRPNPLIQTNDDIPNPRPTVLEWLNTKPQLHGRVAAFASWIRLRTVLREDRCGFPVQAGLEPLTQMLQTQEMRDLNTIKQTVPRPFGDDESLDAPEFFAALEYLRVKHPRVLFLQLIETDAWAHHKEYGEYLNAAHHVDAYLQLLWQTLQSMPQYRNSTTLVLTTDHGRGFGDDWVTHGQTYKGSNHIFAAYLGPDTQPLGVREHIPAITQGQLAATVSALLGQDFTVTNPEIAKPIDDVLPGAKPLSLPSRNVR